jgi:hypothetical protein
MRVFFHQDMIEPAIFELRKKININKMRSHYYKYYEAQAIANLDCYLVIDENNPPMVSDNFMFHIDLKEGAVVEKCKPQMFTEVQKRFLTAKTHILQMTDKIELRNVNLNLDYWNSRLMLVEWQHPEQNGLTKA